MKTTFFKKKDYQCGYYLYVRNIYNFMPCICYVINLVPNENYCAKLCLSYSESLNTSRKIIHFPYGVFISYCLDIF